MNKAELEAAISTLDTFIQIFAVLVAIGILGEVGLGVRHWILSRRLAVIQHAEDLNQEGAIAAMNKEAEAARRDAGLAMERAGKAEENLGQARKDAALAEQHSAEANAKAEGFRLDIAKANERAASANETAERERLARLQLEAKLADRILTPQGRSQLTALAATFPHGTRIDICVFGETLEVAHIAQAISESLTAGGWTIRQWRVMSGASVRGILVGSDPKADTTIARAASGIISTLLAVGIGANPWKFDELVTGAAGAGVRYGPREPMDAPIKMFIGSKQ
jgi:hypothetical protein